MLICTSINDNDAMPISTSTSRAKRPKDVEAELASNNVHVSTNKKKIKQLSKLYLSLTSLNSYLFDRPHLLRQERSRSLDHRDLLKALPMCQISFARYLHLYPWRQHLQSWMTWITWIQHLDSWVQLSISSITDYPVMPWNGESVFEPHA